MLNRFLVEVTFPPVDKGGGRMDVLPFDEEEMADGLLCVTIEGGGDACILLLLLLTVLLVVV